VLNPRDMLEDENSSHKKAWAVHAHLCVLRRRSSVGRSWKAWPILPG
jgi:hypothetical protein